MHQVTFALYGDGTKECIEGYQEPQREDLLYYTQRMITKDEFSFIQRIMKQAPERVNSILSNYI